MANAATEEIGVSKRLLKEAQRQTELSHKLLQEAQQQTLASNQMAQETQRQTRAMIHALCWLEGTGDPLDLRVVSAGAGAVYNVHLQIREVGLFVAGVIPPGRSIVVHLPGSAKPGVGTIAVLHWGPVSTGGGQQRAFQLIDDGQWVPLRVTPGTCGKHPWLSKNQADRIPLSRPAMASRSWAPRQPAPSSVVDSGA